MTSEQFAYWLQGFAELNYNERPTHKQWEAITDHLKQVFIKVTPTYHTGGIVSQPSLRTTDFTTAITC